MKLTITREQFQEGLQAVAAAIPSKTTLPVLSNVLLEATSDGLRLSGTDLDIAVSTMVPASIDQEGAITLPAKKLVESPPGRIDDPAMKKALREDLLALAKHARALAGALK